MVIRNLLVEELRNIFVSAPQETDFLSYNKYKMNFFWEQKFQIHFGGIGELDRVEWSGEDRIVTWFKFERMYLK